MKTFSYNLRNFRRLQLIQFNVGILIRETAQNVMRTATVSHIQSSQLADTLNLPASFTPGHKFTTLTLNCLDSEVIKKSRGVTGRNPNEPPGQKSIAPKPNVFFILSQ